MNGHNFTDTVTKYLLDNQIILVGAQIFGLMSRVAVIFFVHLDPTAPLTHVKLTALVGIDSYPRSQIDLLLLFCLLLFIFCNIINHGS